VVGEYKNEDGEEIELDLELLLEKHREKTYWIFDPPLLGTRAVEAIARQRRVNRAYLPLPIGGANDPRRTQKINT